MTQGITIRHAEPADYDAIVDVMDDWWQRPVASILPRLFLDHFHGTSFVALDHDLAVVGFLVGFHSVWIECVLGWICGALSDLTDKFADHLDGVSQASVCPDTGTRPSGARVFHRDSAPRQAEVLVLLQRGPCPFGHDRPPHVPNFSWTAVTW
ncbi:MAG TPA: hypothetical protein VGI84_05735 [Pseudonocardiaceae bacterium]|jgi:hypothetical protein